VSTSDFPPLVLIKSSRHVTYLPSQTLTLEISSGPAPRQRTVVKTLLREVRRASGRETLELDTLTRVLDGPLRDFRTLIHQRPEAARPAEQIVFWRARNASSAVQRGVVVPWDSPPGTELRYFDQLVLRWPDPWRAFRSSAAAAKSPIDIDLPDEHQVIELRRRPAPAREPDMLRIWIEKTREHERPHRIEQWRESTLLRVIVHSEWTQPVVGRRTWFPGTRSYFDVEHERISTVVVRDLDLGPLEPSDTDPPRLTTQF